MTVTPEPLSFFKFSVSFLQIKHFWDCNIFDKFFYLIFFKFYLCEQQVKVKKPLLSKIYENKT